MQKFTFDGPNKLFIAKSGVTSFDVQIDLYSDWKEEVLLSDNLKYEAALRTVGGDPLVGGRSLGDTYFLINGWRIRPDEATHRLQVDGNLFVEEGSSPFVATTGNYNVVVESFVSNLVDATVAETETKNLQFLIESQRPVHQSYGSVLYVDPINGHDSAHNGTSPENAFKTLAKAIDTTTNAQGDVIFLINRTTGQIYLSEQFEINKSNVSIRGPGSSVVILGSGNLSRPIVKISADGCDLSNLLITSPYAQNLVEVSGVQDFYMNAVIMPGTSGNALVIRNSDGCIVKECDIKNFVGTGIYLNNTTSTNYSNPTVFQDINLHDGNTCMYLAGQMDDIILLRVGMREAAVGLQINSTGVDNVVIDSPSLIHGNYIDIIDPYNKLVNQLTIQQSGQIESLKTSTWLHSSQTTGGKLFKDIIGEMLAMARGKIVETSSGVYDLYGSDNATVLYTLTHAGNARNVS